MAMGDACKMMSALTLLTERLTGLHKPAANNTGFGRYLIRPLVVGTTLTDKWLQLAALLACSDEDTCWCCQKSCTLNYLAGNRG